MRPWIERQKYLLDFALASLSRRKAKNASLLALYAALVFLLASVMLFTEALRRQAAATLASAPDIVVQRMVAGRHDLIAASVLDDLRRIRGVRSAEPRLWGYYYDPGLKANLTVIAAPARAGAPTGDKRVTLGALLADRLAARLHAPLTFESYSGNLATFEVAAILPPATDLIAADTLLMSEPDFREFFSYPDGLYTDLALTVANPRELSVVAGKVTARLTGARAILRTDILRTYESLFNWREGIVLCLLVGAILAFVIFALEKASGLAADERREIGILKAIGWETGDILRLKFCEGALVSLTAFLAGYTAAYFHVFRFSAAFLEPVLRGWSTLLPRLELTPAIDGLQLATLFFLTVFPYALATVAPIWRAAITDPDTVVRG